MTIAAVVFDMDGLMLDTETRAQRCCREAAAVMGFDLDDEFYSASLLGRGWADCDTALAAHFGPRFSVTEFRSGFQGQWSALLAGDSIAVKPGLRELLTMLRSRRIPVAVATSTHAEDAEQSLRAAGVDERFDVFVTGDQVKNGKPHPETASRAGMRTLMVPDGDRAATAEALNAAYRVLVSLHEARHLLEIWAADAS